MGIRGKRAYFGLFSSQFMIIIISLATLALNIQGEAQNSFPGPSVSSLSDLSSPNSNNRTYPQTILPDSPADPSLISDASIFDICESAPGVFWAVGDRGAVWTSSDNGEKWYLVKVPTSANLRAVSFSNELNGLIVGGSVFPGTSNGKGVILRTTDGGRTWDHADTAGIPCLHDLQFREDGLAEVWGDSSELYPSGYFISEDGGENWDSPIRTARHIGWKKGCSTSLFAGLSKKGVPVRFEQSRIVPIEGFSALFPLTALAIINKNILLVGHSGTLFRWCEGETPEKLPLPDEARGFDFETISVSGHTLYLAGNPGTKVFSSNDAGRTWHISQTGVTVPIRKLLTTEGNTVLGVGDFGNIIVSRDGGASWHIKHEGGRRAAWLGLFENCESIPYQWVVSLSLKDGWLGVADILTPTDSVSAYFDEISAEFRAREAFVAAGGSSLAFEPDFPSPPSELRLSLEQITAHWTILGHERPESAFRRRLVQMIRTWRPDLILLSEKNEPQTFSPPAVKSLVYDLTDSQHYIHLVAGYEGQKIDPVKLALMVEQKWDCAKNSLLPQDGLPPLSQMVRAAVLDAIVDAADPNQFPDQIQMLGLFPWKVRRIGVAAENALSISVKTGEYLTCSGESVEEAVARANQIAGYGQDFPVWRGLDLIPNPEDDEVEFTGNLSSPLSDFDIARGSESRRPLTVNPPDKESALGRIQQRRRLFALVDRLTAGANTFSDIFRTNLSELLNQVDHETAAEALLHAGENLIENGNPDYASECFERLVSSYPETAAARPGAARLLRYYAGIERIRRNAIKHPAKDIIGPVTSDLAEKFCSETDYPLPAIVDHASDAVRIGELIRDCYPELYMADNVRFPLAAAQRRAGQVQNAVGYYYNRSNLQDGGDIVSLHASGEYALLNGSFDDGDNSLSLPVGKCNLTTAAPYLDGELEPDVWNQADHFSLFYGKGDIPETNIYLLSGKEFLYIAIVAKDDTPPGNSSLAPRMRDGNMADFDRVEIALDPDRDFCGFYHFVFDCRGWISESCCGDLKWNPHIYSANKKTHFGWVLEAAIPWKEFCDAAPSRGNVWGISIRRIFPGAGFSSWNSNGSWRLEDGFGYLRF